MDHTNDEVLVCPFCEYKQKSEYQMLLHVELQHTEDGESPFAIKDEITASQQRQDEARTNDHEKTYQDGSTRRRVSKRNPSPSSARSHSIYIECPHHCGEQLLAEELRDHTDFHLAQDIATEDTSLISLHNNFSTDINQALRSHGEDVDRLQQPIRNDRWSSLFKNMFTQSSKFSSHATSNGSIRTRQKRERLSRSELGPYAYEARMPPHLVRLLEQGPRIEVLNRIGYDGRIVKTEIISNETPNLIPVLAILSRLDRNVGRAFYCDSSVRHVAKLTQEGGFCGYRNTQMLISYIRDAQAPGYEHFQRRRLPSIFKLQDMIEKAWDMDINSAGRHETGGVKMTRKYIGTSEAQAIFLSLDINAKVEAFHKQDLDESDVYMLLLSYVCIYFNVAMKEERSQKVMVTNRPPLYLQHRGHSLTIVGVEFDIDGKANLVVFDPSYRPIKVLRDLALNNKLSFTSQRPEQLMVPYRRTANYLRKYNEFEVIVVDGPQSTQDS